MIELEEQRYRRATDGHPVRPFGLSAGVTCRGYWTGLQRAMCDFGADEAFEPAADKMKEHYGIEVPVSAIRTITLQHAARMQPEPVSQRHLPEGGVPQLIVETDGSFVPVVSFSEEKAQIFTDRRRCRVVGWKEARRSMARAEGKVRGYYQATMGGVQQAGDQLLDGVIKAGGGQASRLHCLGDGARWIVNQVEERFGWQATYLIDFHHVSDYLVAAAEVLAPEDRLDWLHQQQHRFKTNQAESVLAQLKEMKRTEPADGMDDPVQACEQYVSHRLPYLDYQGALQAGLPIGSGEIESGHRWIIQDRLKLSGAWWKPETADQMLALRTLRANGHWQAYWDDYRQAAA